MVNAKSPELLPDPPALLVKQIGFAGSLPEASSRWRQKGSHRWPEHTAGGAALAPPVY